MDKDIQILPTIFKLLQGQTLSLDECQHDFFIEAAKDGILVVNKSARTIKAKIIKEDRYYYARDRYGHTLLNFVCGYFNDHEDNLLIKYWELLQSPNIPRHDEAPILELNDKDDNSVVLLGKIRYLQESSWGETKGTSLSIETRITYTKLSGIVCEYCIYTQCILLGKEYKEVEKDIKDNSIVVISGYFQPERGRYKFFGDQEVDVIVNDYIVIGNDKGLNPENGDENFFIERSESDCSRYLNKVVLTGVISNIGFKVTRGYPHMTLHLRTRIGCGKEDFLDIPVEIWEKHHKDCFKDLNLGMSIWVEGYFKHPVSKKYYYSYESIDATVFAFKYKVLKSFSIRYSSNI